MSEREEGKRDLIIESVCNVLEVKLQTFTIQIELCMYCSSIF